LFFPNIDPLAGTLASLATFSVGFIARPIGGAIFGHFGDRRGRKIMLMITLVIMALGTFAVGCLPTYQQIGVWAPILLVIDIGPKTPRADSGVGDGRTSNEPAGTPGNRNLNYRDGDEPHGGGGDDQRRDGLAGEGGRTSAARRDKKTTAFSARRGGR